MFVVDGGEADEVHHRVVRNCERRVLAFISNVEMIVVIGDEVFCVGVDVYKLYYTVYRQCIGIDEKQIGQ